MISGRTKSLGVAPAKGPPPARVPQTAKDDRMRATVAVSRGPHRSAAHTSGRTARKPNELRIAVCSMSGLKATIPTAIAATAATPDSRTPRNGRKLPVAHRTMAGVMTSAPATSPSHHMNHVAPTFATAEYPAKLKLLMPTVAPIIVPGPRPSNTNFASPVGVSKVLRPPVQMLARRPPTTASSVLPTAIADEVRIQCTLAAFPISVVAWAVNAPRKIAGQTPMPLNMTAAKARPVGGEIAAALGWIEARVRPTFARTKYAPPMNRSSAASFASTAPEAVGGAHL